MLDSGTQSCYICKFYQKVKPLIYRHMKSYKNHGSRVTSKDKLKSFTYAGYIKANNVTIPQIQTKALSVHELSANIAAEYFAYESAPLVPSISDGFISAVY